MWAGRILRSGSEGVLKFLKKTKLGAIELHGLVGDVRQRVEYEATFEGNERRMKRTE
jgi:peroxin-3